MLGYTVVDPSSVLATHISELIKTHINETIGRQQVQSLLDRVAEKNPKLVEELVPNLLSLGAVQKVLQNLLREKVSIRNAFIFSSRTIRPKFNSTKKPGSKWVEVTAAVDRNSNNRLQTGFDSSIINSIVSDSNAEREKYIKIGGNYVCDSEVPSFTAKFFPYMKQLLLSGFDQDMAWYLIGEASAEYNRGNNSDSICNILMQKIAYHIQCFNRSRVDRIIITKTDESIGLGHLYSPVVSAKIPISYITTGQRVPEDIKPASSQTLSGILLNGFGN